MLRTVSAAAPGGGWQHIAVDPKAAPAASWGVTAVVSNGSTLVFGGEHPLGLGHERFSTLWQIDANSRVRMLPVLSRERPAARRSHAAAALGDNGMLIVLSLIHI